MECLSGSQDFRAAKGEKEEKRWCYSLGCSQLIRSQPVNKDNCSIGAGAARVIVEFRIVCGIVFTLRSTRLTPQASQGYLCRKLPLLVYRRGGLILPPLIWGRCIYGFSNYSVQDCTMIWDLGFRLKRLKWPIGLDIKSCNVNPHMFFLPNRLTILTTNFAFVKRE